jgi:hypothetical protein
MPFAPAWASPIASTVALDYRLIEETLVCNSDFLHLLKLAQLHRDFKLTQLVGRPYAPTNRNIGTGHRWHTSPGLSPNQTESFRQAISIC